jgi:hypothetical protein
MRLEVNLSILAVGERSRGWVLHTIVLAEKLAEVVHLLHALCLPNAVAAVCHEVVHSQTAVDVHMRHRGRLMGPWNDSS